MLDERRTVQVQAKRLRLAREHAGFKSARMAALRLGWKYPTYAGHESAWRALTATIAQKYARAFNVHADFLLFGTRPPEWYVTPSDELTEVAVPIKYMTLFEDETAEEIEKAVAAGRQSKGFAIADLGNLPSNTFALRVKTREMVGPGEGVIVPGDIVVICYAVEKPSAGSVVLLKVHGQLQPSLRRVTAASKGRVRFAAANVDYEPLEEEDVKVLGNVLLHIRQLVDPQSIFA